MRWNEGKQAAEYTFDDAPYPHPEDLVPVLKTRMAGNPKYPRGDPRGTAT